MSAERTVAVWTTVTGGGTRIERLTADGQVHGDGRPPLGEPWFEGDDDPDWNPVCDCPRAPRDWCQPCGGCAACGECTHRPGPVSRPL
jgi:hypothetical protein